MKKIIKLSLSLMVLINLISCSGNQTTVIKNYDDPELARAVNLGFGSYKEEDYTITYADFFKMLDKTVELSAPSKLDEWKSQLMNARLTEKEMKRDEAMISVMFAVKAIYGDSIDFNFNNSRHERITDSAWDEFSWNYPYLPNWNRPVFPTVMSFSEWNYATFGYFYCMSITSISSNKTIFDYDEVNNTMRVSDPFTYTEALLAALRCYESLLEPSIRYQTEEELNILKNVEVRKDSILSNSEEIIVTGTSYYVSNTGNDNNDGLSPETAWATINKINNTSFNQGDGVYFKRGDIWRYDTLFCDEGVTYSAYGVGEKPRFYGSPENGTGKEKWTLLEGTNNIWVFHRKLPFCGLVVFNEGESYADKTWAYWNGKNYTVLGTDNVLIDFKDLENNHFFNNVDLTNWNEYVNGNLMLFNCQNTGELYLRCDEGNPGEIYWSIEFSVINNVSFINVVNGTILDNLCIKYFGNQAVNFTAADKNGATIQNSVVGFVGGAEWGVFPEEKISIGAGGALGMNGASNKALNNYIHDAYDEGITIETGWDKELMENTINSDIIVKGNVFERCVHTLWIANFNEEDQVTIFKDVTFEDNLILYSGYNWRESREEISALGITSPYNGNLFNILIKNNVCYKSKLNLLYFDVLDDSGITFSGNTYVQDNYAPLMRYQTDSYFNNENALDLIVSITKDNDAIVLPLSFTP